MSTALRCIRAVFKRELVSYFTSPIAYVIIIIFLLMSMGFAFWIGSILDNNDATLTWSFFFFLPWFFAILAPAVGMRLWSDEHREGTIELLLTMPVEPWHAIVGKYLASALVWLISLLLTFTIVFTVSYLGDPDMGPIWTGYLGAFLYASACLAITMAVSAFTRSQVVCLIISIAICVGLTLIGFPQVVQKLYQTFPAGMVDAITSLSLMTHFLEMTKGVIVMRDIVYFLSVIVVSLVITAIAIRAKRA